VQTPIEGRSPESPCSRNNLRMTLLAACLLTPAGCGEPSARELKNRQEFEALLTAVSLQNKTELEKDAKRIDDRRASGELSAGGYGDLQEIIKKARDGDWGGAERQAYEFREKRPYFK
jgi:hypothetical protein